MLRRERPRSLNIRVSLAISEKKKKLFSCVWNHVRLKTYWLFIKISHRPLNYFVRGLCFTGNVFRFTVVTETKKAEYVTETYTHGPTLRWFNFILGFKLAIIHTSPYPKTMGNKIKLGIQLKPNFTATCNCIDYSYSCQGFAILRAFSSFSSIEKRLKTRDTTVLHGS